MNPARDGFALVELMIAMLLGLLIISAVGRIYLVTVQAQRTQQELERMRENGRSALAAIVRDLRRAGHFGLAHNPAAIADNSSLHSSTLQDDGHCRDRHWITRIGHPLFGTDDHREHYDCLPSQPVHVGDLLVTRYATPGEAMSAVLEKSFERHPETLFLRTAAGEGRLFEGSKSGLNELEGRPVLTSRLTAHGYFIRTHHAPAPGNCPGERTLPALYRMQAVNGRLHATEVARGIEQLQVRYGIDIDADGAIDRYVDAPGADNSDWQRVRAVRVWLLARSECPEPDQDDTASYAMGNIVYHPASTDLDNDGLPDGDVDGDGTDDYRRELFSTTVALRHRSL